MKYKKIILFLLVISILVNILMFYNTRKYKNIVEDDIEYRLGDVFLSADSLEIELWKIISEKTVDNDQLNKIWSEYEKIIIDLYSLRGTAEKINHQNTNIMNNFTSPTNMQSDLDGFITDIRKDNPNAKAALTDDDIKFIKKFRKIINRIQDIHKKYSYTKGDTVYIKIDQWAKILRELGDIDMMQTSP